DNNGENADRRGKEAAVIAGAEGNRYSAMARPDYYEFLPPGQRMQLQSAAEAETARRDQERSDADDLDRYSMRNTLEDDVTQIAETGVPAAIDPSKVAVTLGPTETAKWLDKRRTAAETYTQTSKLDNMSDNEISALLDDLEPKAGQDNFDRA